MSLMRMDLTKQLAKEINDYLIEKYDISAYEDIKIIINNGLGFIVETIEEQAVEINII